MRHAIRALCAAVLVASVLWCYRSLGSRVGGGDWDNGTLGFFDLMQRSIVTQHMPVLRIEGDPVMLGLSLSDVLGNPGAPLLTPWLFLSGCTLGEWVRVTAVLYALVGALGMFAVA